MLYCAVPPFMLHTRRWAREVVTGAQEAEEHFVEEPQQQILFRGLRLKWWADAVCTAGHSNAEGQAGWAWRAHAAASLEL